MLKRVINFIRQKFNPPVKLPPTAPEIIENVQLATPTPKFIIKFDAAKLGEFRAAFYRQCIESSQNLKYREIPLVEIKKLDTFAEAFACFLKFRCDRSCNNGSDVCVHVFIFACPNCGKPIRAHAEEMEVFAQAGEGCVCMSCFDLESLNSRAA